MPNLKSCLAALAMAWPLSAPAGIVDLQFVESNNYRPGAVGDLPVLDIGALSPDLTVGISGRIVSAQDMFTFSTSGGFTMVFASLLGDGVEGFDSTYDGAASADQTGKLATFKLTGQADVTFASDAPNTRPGDLIFTSTTAGSFIFTIDGTDTKASAYDIILRTLPAGTPVTTPVPVPAALPLLVGGIGALAWMRHRKRHAT